MRSFLLASIIFIISSGTFAADSTYYSLCDAIDHKDIEGVRKCLVSIHNAGGSVNHTPEGCNTPLINAVRCGDLDIVELLLNFGADPNLSRFGYTPLDHAIGYSCLPCIRARILTMVRLLLSAGATVNSNRDKNSRTYLQMACSVGNLELVNFFLAARSDVNAISFESALTSTSHLETHSFPECLRRIWIYNTLLAAGARDEYEFPEQLVQYEDTEIQRRPGRVYPVRDRMIMQHRVAIVDALCLFASTLNRDVVGHMVQILIQLGFCDFDFALQNVWARIASQQNPYNVQYHWYRDERFVPATLLTVFLFTIYGIDFYFF